MIREQSGSISGSDSCDEEIHKHLLYTISMQHGDNRITNKVNE